jgi:hypothetical protein
MEVAKPISFEKRGTQLEIPKSTVQGHITYGFVFVVREIVIKKTLATNY